MAVRPVLNALISITYCLLLDLYFEWQELNYLVALIE